MTKEAFLALVNAQLQTYCDSAKAPAFADLTPPHKILEGFIRQLQAECNRMVREEQIPKHNLASKEVQDAARKGYGE
jgi:hypothetical protein